MFSVCWRLGGVTVELLTTFLASNRAEALDIAVENCVDVLRAISYSPASTYFSTNNFLQPILITSNSQ